MNDYSIQVERLADRVLELQEGQAAMDAKLDILVADRRTAP